MGKFSVHAARRRETALWRAVPGRSAPLCVIPGASLDSLFDQGRARLPSRLVGDPCSFLLSSRTSGSRGNCVIAEPLKTEKASSRRHMDIFTFILFFFQWKFGFWMYGGACSLELYAIQKWNKEIQNCNVRHKYRYENRNIMYRWA